MNSSSSGESSSLAAVFRGPGQPFELVHFPTPDVQPAEALVRVECCTLCGSDLHTLSGTRNECTPSILGHEILGVVEQVGSPPPSDCEGAPLAPGDRVTWSVAVSCGDCDRCRSGLPQKCRSLVKYGHELCEGRAGLSGGLAERILLKPGTTVAKLPRDMPAEVMCPVSCATSTVMAAIRESGSPESKRVIVFGAGMLGLTAAAIAQTARAARVVVCDVDPARLQQAERFGADETLVWRGDTESFCERVRRQWGPDGFDLALELSGAADAVEAACQLAATGGTVVLVGSVMNSRPVQVDPESLVRRCLSIHGVHNYAPEDLRRAVRFLVENHQRYPFAKLVRYSYPLNEINHAVETALKERPVRIAIRP